MMDVSKRIQDCLNRCDQATRKIRTNQAKVQFKRDLQVKRLQQVVGTALEKLTSIYEIAQKEITDSVESRRKEMVVMENACLERTAVLRALDKSKRNQRSHDLDGVLNSIEHELENVGDWLDSQTNFDLVISSEVSGLCQSLISESKPIYVQTSILLPSQVQICLLPTTADIDGTIITVLAIPTRPIFRLNHLLSATLETLAWKESTDEQRTVKGMASPVNDKSGNVKITFPSVPRVGEYLVKVLMYGKQVENSPMVVRVTENTPSPQPITNGDSKEMKIRRTRSVSFPAVREDTPNGRDSPARLCSVDAGGSMLSILANRARHSSGGGKTRDPAITANGAAAVAVASKAANKPTVNGVKQRNVHGTIV